MIQEKDFINKASIKTAQVRMSDGQISTPEILVTEKGDFTGGNILDANSVAELINSSSASGDYVQYSAKSTEDYTIPLQFIVANNINQGTTKISSAGIHHSNQGDLDFCKGTLVFEQNNKTFGMAFDNQENKYDYTISANDSDDRFHFNKDIAIPGYISLKAALDSKYVTIEEFDKKMSVIDGDSNTEGSFRKAIADVVAAAPEDLDTLKEIADKLAGNDDLHTALNQAITEKADTSALLNEVTRATGVENDLKASIATKQDSGDYIPYDPDTTGYYAIDRSFGINFGPNAGVILSPVNGIDFACDNKSALYDYDGINIKGIHGTCKIGFDGIHTNSNERGLDFQVGVDGITFAKDGNGFTIAYDGINFLGAEEGWIPKATGNFIDINDYVLKTAFSTALEGKQDKPAEGKEFLQVIDDGGTMVLKNNALRFGDSLTGVWSVIGSTGLLVYGNDSQVNITSAGIESATNAKSDTKVWNTNGGITDLTSYTTTEALTAIEQKVATKQDKIVPKTIDVTGIETADISKLRAIVSNLLDALTLSGLIKQNAEL